MQQATVNLFADMGAQPATLQAGLVAATASTDATRADLDHHRRRRTARTVPAEQHRHDHRHRRRHRRRRRRRRRGLGRRRRDLAPRHGRATWTYSLDAGAARHRTTCAAAPSTTAATSRRRRRHHGDRRHRQRDLPVLDLGRRRHAGRARRDDRHGAVELGAKFRTDDRRLITGVRFYKGARNTGTHVGHLWTAHRHAARHRDVHQRDRVGLAAGALRHAGRRRPRTRPTSSPTSPRTATTRATIDYFADRRRRQRRRCTRLRDGEDGGNGVYRYGAERLVPRLDLAAENYWVDVVFDDGRDRAGHDAADGRRGHPGPRRDRRRDRRQRRPRRFSEPMTPATITGRP